MLNFLSERVQSAEIATENIIPLNGIKEPYCKFGSAIIEVKM